MELLTIAKWVFLKMTMGLPQATMGLPHKALLEREREIGFENGKKKGGV